MPGYTVVSTQYIDSFGQDIDVKGHVSISLVHVIEFPKGILSAFFPMSMRIVIQKAHYLSNTSECFGFVDVPGLTKLLHELIFVTKNQLVCQNAFVLEGLKEHLQGLVFVNTIHYLEVILENFELFLIKIVPRVEKFEELLVHLFEAVFLKCFVYIWIAVAISDRSYTSYNN